MKNRPLPQRFGFAVDGIRAAWKLEKSFRTQVVMAAGVAIVLAVFRASPTWWALIMTNISLVIGAELFNTALEQTLDVLHPTEHPGVKIAKDVSAGAVLVFSVVSVIVFICYLTTFPWYG